jgi:hypothetical protein
VTIQRWLVGALLVAAACGNSHKQIVLSVDTTAGIPCDIDHIRIRANRSQDSVLVKDISDVRNLPVTLRLSDETSDGMFDLEITGLKGTTEVLRASGHLAFGSGSQDLASHVVLDQTCTIGTPCALPDLTQFASAPPPVTARFVCGDNVRRYMPSPAVETFSDACTVPGANTGMVLNDGSHGAKTLPLPDTALSGFGFRFYGRPVRQIWADGNGYISFTTANPDPGNDRDPGSFDRDLINMGVPPPPQSAMVFWDTLTVSSTGVCYALEGPPGTQKLRITWKSTCQTQVCTQDSLNFTIILDEHTQRISFTYGDMIATNMSRAQGATATVGLVNDAKGCRVSDCALMTGLCKDGITACGYTQVFSNMPQTPRIQNVQFDPIVDRD